MSHRIQLRRDKAAFWAQEDPVLAQGELAWSTDTGELKIGDGTTPWSGLANILGNPGEPGGSSETLIFDTAGQLWDSEDFGDIPHGTLILIRDYGAEQQNAGGALLRMVNDGVSEPNTETVVVGIPGYDQFRANQWLYGDTSALPEYTLASSVSMSVALPSDQIRIQEEVGGAIRIYFPADTAEEREIGRYSKAAYILLALNDFSKAAILNIGGDGVSGGDKNYWLQLATGGQSVLPVNSSTPLLDIQDILNGVHDSDTFIVGNAAITNSTARWGQEEKATVLVNTTIQPNPGSGTPVTDPGSGYIGFNSLDLTKLTRIVVSKTAFANQAILDFILDEGTTPSGEADKILILDFPDQGTGGFMVQLGYTFDAGDYLNITAKYIGSGNGDLLHILEAGKPVEMYLLHNPFEVSIDLSNYVTQDEFQEVLSGIFTLPRPLSVPIGFQPEVTHTGTGYEPISQLGGIMNEAVQAVNAGASMVLELNLNYYLKPNGTQPLVRLKIGNIEVKLPAGNIPGVDSFLYFEGTVTLFISKPAADLQIKAMTRFRSYESFSGGPLQDDLLHFPGDYLGNDDYTVMGGLLTDGAWANTDPWLQFNADLGIKARLEKVSGQYSLAF